MPRTNDMEMEMSDFTKTVVDDAMLERAWIAASSACVAVVDGEHRYVAPLSPSDWYAALKPAIEAALSSEPHEKIGAAPPDAVSGGDARAQFEAWAKGQGYSVEWKNGRYVQRSKQIAYHAWQAAIKERQ